MMKGKKLILLCLLFGISTLIHGQSRKNIKKNSVSSKTEWNYSYHKGKQTTYKSAYLKYDKNGRVLEEVTYKEDGSIKKRETMKYNSDGDIKEIISFFSNGTIKRKIVYVYDEHKMWIEKIYYNGKNEIIEKRKRSFTYYEE